MLPEGLEKYFIAIIPPSPLYEEIDTLKNYFKEKYKSQAALNSPPHITLHMPFQWKRSKEEILISSLENFSKERTLLPVELQNFSCFAPRVIFINVKKNESLNNLQKELQRFCRIELNLFHADYKDLPFHPHITLAFRDLRKSQFIQAWEEFKDKEFNRKFEFNRLILLKHTGNWEVSNEFLLK